MIKQSNEGGVFEIHHHFLQEDKWQNFKVGEIDAGKILNPIKVFKDNNKILLSYYDKNKIHIREFDSRAMEWSDPISLTDDNEKLYVDIMKIQDSIHLVYCNFLNGNFVVKYMKYNYHGRQLQLEVEEDLSNEGNAAYPTLLVHEGVLWVIWKESLALYSRCSFDGGNSWSPIYLWKDSKTADYYRYKYIGKTLEGKTQLHYSFGSIHPDIRFMGFGALENTETLPLKKKTKAYILHRI